MSALDNRPTRRAMLGTGMIAAIAAVPAVGFPFPRQHNSFSPAKTSPRFAALIAQAEAAEQVSACYHVRIYTPAADRMNEAVAKAEAAHPHVVVRAGPSMGGGEVVWSTAKPSSVAVTRSIIAMSREGKDVTSAGLIPARRLYAAHLKRTRAVERALSRSGVSAIADESDRLDEIASEAASAVAAHPISTAADLRAKLRFMTDHSMGDGMDWLKELSADAERIVAGQDRA